MNLLSNILYKLFIILIILLSLTFTVLEIYVWIKYGGMPAGEIPGWALWLMFKS